MNDWKIDILWVLNYFVNLHTLTPFSPGWNCTLIGPRQYTQKVWDLPQTNQSPTNHSILAETMCISLQIVQEAIKISTAVTYDLAIAKIALCFFFHIEMAYFKVVGKIISKSGVSFLLQECQASIKSFLSGLSYDLCKRLDEILDT